MIDLHSHILPGVDDGSSSERESLAILDQLHTLGFDEFYLTPHFIENSTFSSSKKHNKAAFSPLQSHVDQDITLHLANEVFLSTKTPELLKKNRFNVIKDRFVLIELPLYGKIRGYEDILHEIRIAGYTPIIAHPERYDFVKSHPEVIADLRASGALIQCNYGSLVGIYGRRTTRTVKYLLRHQLVDFMGTDIHHDHSRALDKLGKSLRTLRRLVSTPYFTYLTEAQALDSTITPHFPKKRHIVRNIIITITSLIVTATLAFAAHLYFGFRQFLSDITVTPDQPASVVTTPDIEIEPFNVFISGIDTHGEIVNVSRSDVNMIATVNPDTHTILLTSIPRDYYVQLHGTTGLRDKLTHAGIYGVDMSRTTLEDLFGITIDHYIRINFDTVTQIVDTIDGIDITPDHTFRAWTDSSCEYTANTPMHLYGPCALAYARERYAYAEGDHHRVKNQQDVLSAVVDKLSTDRSLIFVYPKLLDILGKSIQTDVPTKIIDQLIRDQITDSPTWHITKNQVTGTGSMDYTYSMPSQPLYVMIPDMASVTSATDIITKVLIPPTDDIE